MSLLRRVFLGGIPIGLVVALGLSNTPLVVAVHQPAVQRAIITVPIAANSVVDWPDQVQVAQQAAADAEALAAEVAALNAAEAQALADQLAAAAKRLQEAPSLPLGPVVAPPAPSGDFAAFRACTIEIESHGNYQDVDSTQTYWGAWQFDQGTWDGAVSRAGHPEWAGQRPNGAPPAIQDAAAYQLWTERGNQPWGGRC